MPASWVSWSVDGCAAHRPGSPSALRLQTRSLRVSNRRLRDATVWRPAYTSLGEGWNEVLTRLRAVTAKLEAGGR